MSQDLLYSVPIYNKLRSAGLPKYPAFFISGGIGGAIGIEDKIMGAESTFSQDIFSKDIIELKNLIGILPNTPEDKIADEVVQALEYGAFSVAIPGIIDGFKFMKKYIPAMTATAAGTTALSTDNEAEGSPLKAIVNAVDNIPMFKSAVVDAADKIPAVANGDQIFNTIKNTTGVKANELKWMDLEGFLKGKTKVSKEEVLEYINANKIDVTETKLSNTAPANLPDDIQQTVDDFERKYFDQANLGSDTGAGIERGVPNYDVYKFKATVYKNADQVNNLGEPTQATLRANTSKDGFDIKDIQRDFSSMNKNPLMRAMDRDAEIFGTGTAFEDIKKYLLPWVDDTTGKYTGHVVDIDPKLLKTSDYYLVSDQNNSLAVSRFLVSSNSLDSIGEGNFKRITKYEIDEIELEKFNIEDDVRQFRLSKSYETDQTLFENEYTVKGGEDYTELVFKVKHKSDSIPAEFEGEFGEQIGNKVKTKEIGTVDYKNLYHFNQFNEFAHVRFKTRMLNGKKVLTVEEMQSDIQQASKKELFANAQKPRISDLAGKAYGDKTLKDFPFKNTWYEFTIKRLARYASDNGFDAIAIPKGELAANRYGQSIEKLAEIEAVPNGPYSARITFKNNKGKNFKTINFNSNIDDTGFDFFESLNSYEKEVGDKYFPEFQQMVINATEESGVANKIKFDEEYITGSGKGKFHLYDRTIPGYMKKYAKKWNAKVFDDKFETGTFSNSPDIPVTVLELSPEMKTGVTKSSQPLFELFGTVGLSTWGAKAVSDSMENNSISQTTN
jgi:hypothetical protein